MQSCAISHHFLQLQFVTVTDTDWRIDRYRLCAYILSSAKSDFFKMKLKVTTSLSRICTFIYVAVSNLQKLWQQYFRWYNAQVKTYQGLGWIFWRLNVKVCVCVNFIIVPTPSITRYANPDSIYLSLNAQEREPISGFLRKAWHRWLIL